MQPFFDFLGHLEEREPVLQELAYLLRPGERVLDIATGSGYLARKLKTQRVTMVDIDPSLVRKSSRWLPGTWVCADATRLPFRDRAFDSSVTWTGLAHIPAWQRLLAEMVRVSGMKVLVAEPKGEFALRAFRDFRCTHPVPSIEELTETLERFGEVEVLEREYFLILVARLL